MKAIQISIGILLVFFTAVTIFPLEFQYFRFFATNAKLVMLSLLLLGIILLLVKRDTLTFVCFGCCAVLALFLKQSANSDLSYAERSQQEAIKVLHVNTSNSENDPEQLLADIYNEKPDLLTIQELTPDWHYFLKESLADSFPYSKSILSIGFDGMAVYSKLPFEDIDTFKYKDTPNILGSVKANGKSGCLVNFVMTYTQPVGSSVFYSDLKNHLATIIDKTKEIEGAKIMLGAYNTVEWSSELQDFTNKLTLKNSRRALDLFNREYEHIFYSEKLECTNFSDFYSSDGVKIGMKGTYQFKAPRDEKKTAKF